MVTIYKRATPSQRRLLKIVEGAVKNARDAHRYNNVSDNFARSIAKRAAGTISAQWPELLAAKMPSDRAKGHNLVMAQPSCAHLAKHTKRGAAQVSGSRTPPSPFKRLYTSLGAMAGWARKAGHESRAAALADALRVIARVEAELKDR